MAEFLPNIPMAFSPNFSEEPRVRRVKFGDGYEARVADGLNRTAMQISVPWKNRTHQELLTLMDFFRRHDGRHWFFYTPHGEGIRRKFVCSKWSYSRSSNSSVLSPRFDIDATFYQVFDLV